jgi:hypothetical protein
VQLVRCSKCGWCTPLRVPLFIDTTQVLAIGWAASVGGPTVTANGVGLAGVLSSSPVFRQNCTMYEFYGSGAVLLKHTSLLALMMLLPCHLQIVHCY